MNTWNAKTPAVSVCGEVHLCVCVCVPLRYLYVLSVLLLRLVLPLLVLQSVLFGFDEVLVVAAVTVQPLGVQVDDVRHHGVQEVPVVGHHQDGGLPRLKKGEGGAGSECDGQVSLWKRGFLPSERSNAND